MIPIYTPSSYCFVLLENEKYTFIPLNYPTIPLIVKNIKISLTTKKYSRTIKFFIHCVLEDIIMGSEVHFFKLLIWQMCHGAM